MNKKQLERFTELRNKAREEFLIRTDFSTEDWLEEKEKDEWEKLRELYIKWISHNKGKDR